MKNPVITPLFEDASSIESLHSAWRQTRRKKGGPGGDGMSIQEFSHGLEARLTELSKTLRSGGYHPGPLTRYPIEKTDGGRRWLAIPTVTDRVAQGAFARAISEKLDGEMADASFAYRPGRSVEAAIGRVLTYKLWGFGHVVDADIKSFFLSLIHI